MVDYVEIESTTEIKALNRKLADSLVRKFKLAERRTIGYPQGSFETKTRFKDKREGSFWWSPGESRGNNFFGHGTLGDRSALNIDIQYNLPVKQFSRRLGGAFLKRISTNSVVLAHRGHVTLGHARIKRDALFAEMSATLIQAVTSDGLKDFLLIGELDGRYLSDDLEEFAVELRRTARVIKERATREVDGKKRVARNGFSKLTDYTDEFWGRRKVSVRGDVTADCNHGKVVRALRDWLEPRCVNVEKSRDIDLVAKLANTDLLFEVKTSIAPQSVYTAVGQLSVHSQVLANREKRQARQVMVLPETPHKELYDTLSNGLGIALIRYTLAKENRVKFSGLEKLVR